jgi:hypothetical protein
MPFDWAESFLARRSPRPGNNPDGGFLRPRLCRESSRSVRGTAAARRQFRPFRMQGAAGRDERDEIDVALLATAGVDDRCCNAGGVEEPVQSHLGRRGSRAKFRCIPWRAGSSSSLIF